MKEILIYNQGKISAPSFSFYLLSNKDQIVENNISRFYIGAILENDYINNLFKNKTKFCYLPGKNYYWICETIKIEIKEEKLNITEAINS